MFMEGLGTAGRGRGIKELARGSVPLNEACSEARWVEPRRSKYAGANRCLKWPSKDEWDMTVLYLTIL